MVVASGAESDSHDASLVASLARLNESQLLVETVFSQFLI